MRFYHLLWIKHSKASYDGKGRHAAGVTVHGRGGVIALLPSVLDRAFKGEL